MGREGGGLRHIRYKGILPGQQPVHHPYMELMSVLCTLQVRTARKARADGATSTNRSIVVLRHVKILVEQQPNISTTPQVSLGPRLEVSFRLPLLFEKAFLLMEREEQMRDV